MRDHGRQLGPVQRSHRGAGDDNRSWSTGDTVGRGFGGVDIHDAVAGGSSDKSDGVGVVEGVGAHPVDGTDHAHRDGDEAAEGKRDRSRGDHLSRPAGMPDEDRLQSFEAGGQ